MTHKFRCVQTLHTGNSAAKSTRIVNPQFVFKDVGSFGQETEKELGGSIFGGLVITCAFFPCAARKLVNRFEAGSPKVFECPVLPDMFFNCKNVVHWSLVPKAFGTGFCIITNPYSIEGGIGKIPPASASLCSFVLYIRKYGVLKHDINLRS